MEDGGKVYNPDIKNKFLNSIVKPNMIENFTRLFKQTEAMEIEQGTDLCNIPTEEVLVNMIASGRVKSINSVRAKYQQTKKYKIWAIVNNYVDEDSKFIEQDIDCSKLLCKYNQGLVFKSPKELVTILSTYLTDVITEDEGCISIDELCLATAMLLYQGFTKDEVMHVKLEDVVVNDNYIIIKNERQAIKVYEEFKPLILKVYNNRYIYNRRKSMLGKIAMTDYFLSYGDYSPEKGYDRIRRRYYNLVYTKIDKKFKLDDVYIMGGVYISKSFNYTVREMYKYHSYGLTASERNNMKIMYSIW